MRKFLLFFMFLFVLASCANESDSTDDAPSEGGDESIELKELKARISELEIENARKDSVMIQTARTFDEIATNLSQIAYKQGRIRKEGMNVEAGEDPKEWILQEIQEINALREENARKVAGLQATVANLQGANQALTEENAGLNALIETLNNQIAVQEQDIEMLKVQLDNLDKDYANMFDAYLDASELAEEKTKELNTAYYAYGTKRELKDNGVISKEGGFIGLGKTSKLKNDFNDTYFEQIDITQKKEFDIIGRKPKLITSHPSSSYTLEEGEESSKLIVNDPQKFWGASKYLVIQVQ